MQCTGRRRSPIFPVDSIYAQPRWLANRHRTRPLSARSSIAYVNFAARHRSRRFIARKSLPRWRLVFVMTRHKLAVFICFLFFASNGLSFTHCCGGRLIIHAGESIIIGQSATATATAAAVCRRYTNRCRFLSSAPRSSAVMRAIFSAALSSPSNFDIHSCPKTRGDSFLHVFLFFWRNLSEFASDKFRPWCNLSEGNVSGNIFIDTRTIGSINLITFISRGL